MSARLKIWGACRALAVRSRPLPTRTDPRLLYTPSTPCRLFADDANKQPPSSIETTNPSSQPAPSQQGNDGVEEPSADQLSEKFTVTESTSPQESMIDTLGDSKLQELFYGGRTVTSEGDVGLSAAQEEVLYREGTIPPLVEAEALVAIADTDQNALSGQTNALSKSGLKFGLPTRPFPQGFNLKSRYHPVLEQITRILMKDGKLSVAQRNMATVMNFLRTAPAPIYSPKFPLLPGTPPASHLPLNPVLYMTIALDSVAPLIKVRGLAGAAGGGRALDIPIPLAVRQRRRTAFKWILEVVNKRPSMGSGRKQLPHRIAEEIIAVVEGRSGVWEKRKFVHKTGTAARANLVAAGRKRQKKFSKR